MELTKKIRIYPTEEQESVIWVISDFVRRVYNFALADKQDTWHNEKRPVKYLEQQNKLPEFKKNNPEFKVVYSKVYQSILKKLDSAYRSTITKWKKGDYTAELPKFKSHKYILTIPYNESGFKIKDGKITFSHYVNDTQLTFDIGSIADGLKIKQVEISNDNPYKARGKFYVTITYEEDVKIPFVDNGKIDAIDLGITKIVTSVNTEGEFFEVKTPRPDQYWNPKIDAAKSRRDHCLGGKKGQNKSKKYRHIAKAVSKMSRKKRNQIKDFQHKLSRKMVDKTTANTIIVGDLSVQQMAQPKIKDGKKQKKNKGLNRSTQGLGNLSRFPQLLTYKADLVGKKVIRVDERNTSRACCCCGKLHDMPEWKRVMSCDCGNVIDRDRNSAINIMVRYLSLYAPDALSTFVDNLRTGFMRNCGSWNQSR
ncbi:MAG TPA: transposase [Candidatus Bathyarchaeia archaeon]|nr:transposase [Candidatus Bathyarchaeia archaeon]